MDDLDTLREAWGEPKTPSPTARMQARAALMTRAAGRPPEPVRPRRRFRLPRAGALIAAGALATVVAAGVVVVQTSGGSRDSHSSPPGGQVGSVALAANVLDRASAAAEHRHFTPLRSHQWIYTKMSHTTGTGPGGVVTGGPYRTRVEETWWRADGEQSAADHERQAVCRTRGHEAAAPVLLCSPAHRPRRAAAEGRRAHRRL